MMLISYLIYWEVYFGIDLYIVRGNIQVLAPGNTDQFLPIHPYDKENCRHVF